MQKYLYILLLLWTANSNSMSYVKSFFGYNHSYFTTLLFQAASNDSILRMQEALNNYADANTQDLDLDTPLHIAANNGHHRAVRVLLDNGATVDIRNNNNETALHRAVDNGHQRAVELLLNSNADIAAESTIGTPLYYAILANNTAIVQLLVHHGAEPSERDMALAARNNHYQVIIDVLTNAVNNQPVKNSPVNNSPIVDNNPLASQEECCICSEIVENPAEVKLPCEHGKSIHYLCLEKWKDSKNNPYCPMCRGPLE
jgi:ankyrin repeat protein